jgi:hypothetical protein
MTLDREGIRPALIDMPMSLRIEELLKFRHVFRNIYKSPLLPAKVNFADEAVKGLATDFREYHEAFLSFLRTLADELDGSTR